MIYIVPVTPNDFHRISGYLETALRRGGGEDHWNLGDVYEQVCNRDVLAWAFYDNDILFGAGVSVIYDYPRKRVVDIALMCTDIHCEDKWSVALEQFKQYAASVGASAITGAGRAGWARKLNAIAKPRFEIPVHVA